MDADLIVIGNGVVGLSAAIACRHRDPDLRVILVGPTDRRGAATPAAAAMLAAASEARPTTFEEPAATAWIELLATAVGSWPDWVRTIAQRSGVPSGLVPEITRGMVVVGDEVDEGFDAIHDAAARLGVAMTSIDPTEVDLLRRDEPRRCLRLEDEGGVDPLALLRLLDACTVSSGITRLDARVRRAEPGRVLLENGKTLRAGNVLIASGSGCRRILKPDSPASLTVPVIRFSHGVGLRGRFHPRSVGSMPVIRTPNRPDGGNIYLVPHGGGGRYLGASTSLEDEARYEPTEHEISMVRLAADRYLNSDRLFASFVPVIGSRPATEDGLPVMGMIEEGLWIATGTDRDGLSAAPELSSVLADALVAGSDRIHPGFKPSHARTMAMSGMHHDPSRGI